MRVVEEIGPIVTHTRPPGASHDRYTQFLTITTASFPVPNRFRVVLSAHT